MKSLEKKSGSPCDTRFKHKLNMLEPGTVLLKWIGILGAVGLALLLLHWKTLACCMLGLSGALFVLLLILLAIEAHQDKVLNEIALREDLERERGERENGRS